MTVALGQFYGRLEVIESLGAAGRGVALWRCRCTCGETVHELTTDLVAGDVVSCGDCRPATPWSPAEDALLRAEYADTPNQALALRTDRTRLAVKSRATLLGLRKSAAFLSSPAAGRIQPGSTPPNKGKTGLPVHPNTVRTQFRRGNRPQTWRPIGTEKLSKEGYLLRKVSETGYPPDDWRPVHHLLWIESGRELPKGHALTFANGDRTDIRIDNLVLVHRSELMRRNSRHQLPPEVNELIGLRAALSRKINRKERELNEEPNK